MVFYQAEEYRRKSMFNKEDKKNSKTADIKYHV